MSYSTHDTNWDQSSKGNYWRRFDGKLLVVGTKYGDYYWAMIDGNFLDDQFLTIEDAQDAAENEAGVKDISSEWW